MISQLRPPEHMLRKHKDLASPPEAEIRDPALDLDLANQHPAAIPHVDPVSTASVYVAKDIAFHTVRRSSICVREDPSIGQIRGVVLPKDAVGVDGRCTPRVWGATVGA